MLEAALEAQPDHAPALTRYADLCYGAGPAARPSTARPSTARPSYSLCPPFPGPQPCDGVCARMLWSIAVTVVFVPVGTETSAGGPRPYRPEAARRASSAGR